MWLILIAMILLPGLCLASWFFQRHVVLLLATPLSLLLYVGVAVVFYLLDRTDWILRGYIAVMTFIIIVTLASSQYRATLGKTLIGAMHFLPVAITFFVYNTLAGAFVDFGIDIYQHMVYLQQALESIRENGDLKIKLVSGNANLIFYNIGALFAVSFGLDVPQLMEVISVSYTFLWTLSVYCFCFLIFGHITTTEKQAVFLTYLSVVFYWTAFGINNFSFPRNYYGGPAILNYCVYLAALWLFLRQLISGFSIRDSLTILALVALAGLLHEQEALMLVIFAMGLSFVVITLRIIGVRKTQDIPLNGVNTAISALVLVAFAAGLLLLIYFLPKYRFDPVSLLNLGVLSQRLSGWNILRPDHQFYTVLGFWGLYVYAVSFIYIKQVGRNTILLVTLVLPIITVFNPVFVEAFSKLAYSAVLWRMLFVLQLPILASYIVGLVIFRWRREDNPKINLVRLASIVPIFVLLIPFQVGVFNNAMTKIPSLIKTPQANSYRQWQDLVDYLNGLQEKNHILTDPVTGYAVRALTHQHHRGYKFFPINYNHFNFESYDDKPLEKYKNSLLVLNLRNGDINTRLNPPHHIYPDVMKVDKYYDQPIIEELNNNPENYPVLWSKDNISVYRIR